MGVAIVAGPIVERCEFEMSRRLWSPMGSLRPETGSGIGLSKNCNYLIDNQCNIILSPMEAWVKRKVRGRDCFQIVKRPTFFTTKAKRIRRCAA
jgi:hypothetical protein